MAHILAHGIGVFSIALYLGWAINSALEYDYLLHGLYGLFESHKLNKVWALIHYVFSVLGIFFILGLLQYVWIKRAEVDKASPLISGTSILATVVSGFGSSLFLYWWTVVAGYSGLGVAFNIGLVWWLFSVSTFFIYLAVLVAKKRQLDIASFERSRQIGYFSIFVAVISLVVVFSPLLIGKVHVLNDFVDMPESTVFKDGRSVDNHKFINENNLFGLCRHDPRDIELSKNSDYNERLSVSLPYRDSLAVFMNSAIDNNVPKYVYDRNNGRLIVRGKVSENELVVLKQIFPEFSNEIILLYNNSFKVWLEQKKKTFSKEEYEFFKLNLLEMSEQFHLGRFFYHHNYLVSPAIGMAMGKENLPSVYGVGLTKAFSKIFELYGFNYSSYLKILYGSYVFYWLLFFGLAYLIWGEVLCFTIVAVAGATSIAIQHPILLAMAPGFSPLRHILDVVVFYLVWRYFKLAMYRYLVFGYVLALISIWWNTQYGVFLFVAILVVDVCGVVIEGRFRKLYSSAGFSLLALCVLKWISRENPLERYMLFGLGAPNTPVVAVCLLLLIIAAIGAGMLLLWHRRNAQYIRAEWLITMAVVVYVSEGIVYALWYFSDHHFYPVVFPWTIFALVGMLWMYYGGEKLKLQKSAFLVAISISFSFLLVIVTGMHLYSQNQIASVFKGHVNYDWNFSSAGFATTMQPGPVEDALRLIAKYGDEECVHFISRYDVILPALANKCMAGQFVTLTDIFVTQKEKDMAVNTIMEDQPIYLFVDSDIGRTFAGDIPAPGQLLDRISSPTMSISNMKVAESRALFLGYMFDVFEAVRGKYVELERGQLITVYKRI
ncbi:hypothetical protein A1353_12750 [Methylomonas methanica]|uniref:Uncharacterized protein n=2 Tax=Methylomonas methanica TaxID=421 RepID=A0A177MFR8_METMH|nr:hypothetical protein A1353_12750 [Methylomonas methanica]